MSSIASPELAAQMAESLGTRLFQELKRLKAPPKTFELLYGFEFFSVYPGSHLEAMNSDFPAMLHSSIRALMDTGGLR